MIYVLVDLSYIAYRALHTMGDLEHDDVTTGVIYGFFNQIRNISNDHRVQSNKILLFCDTRSSFRSDLYPGYKKKRRDTRTDEQKAMVRTLREQVNRLRDEICPSIGFPVYYQEGLESDDLLAFAARLLSANACLAETKARQGVIITGDGDLFQCITPWVHWFDPARDKYYDPPTFMQKKHVPAHRYGEVKAITGCRTDCVPGVLGVGEPTAIKFLNGMLPPRFKAHQAIINNQELIERNRKLVVLPHEQTERFKLTEPEYNTDAFFSWCEEFGLRSFLRTSDSWTSFFNGTRFSTRKRGKRRG